MENDKIEFDEFVKSLQGRHSRESGSPTTGAF